MHWRGHDVGKVFTLKFIGVWLAQAILVLTGNLALAASLRVLPSRFSLPVRIVAEGKSVRLEYLAGPLEWDQYLRQEGLTKGIAAATRSIVGNVMGLLVMAAAPSHWPYLRPYGAFREGCERRPPEIERLLTGSCTTDSEILSAGLAADRPSSCPSKASPALQHPVAESLSDSSVRVAVAPSLSSPKTSQNSDAVNTGDRFVRDIGA